MIFILNNDVVHVYIKASNNVYIKFIILIFLALMLFFFSLV